MVDTLRECAVGSMDRYVVWPSFVSDLRQTGVTLLHAVRCRHCTIQPFVTLAAKYYRLESKRS